VLFKIVSKVLVDVGVLGRCREEVLFLIFPILGLVGGDVSKDVEAGDWGRRNRGTGDDICGAVRNIEGVVFWVVEDRPSELRGWGTGDDGLEDAGGDVKRAWVIPGVVRALEDLKDGSGGVRNVLLVDIIKGGPGGDGDVGEGGGGDDGGLRGSEQHLRQLAPL